MSRPTVYMKLHAEVPDWVEAMERYVQYARGLCPLDLTVYSFSACTLFIALTCDHSVRTC